MSIPYNETLVISCGVVPYNCLANELYQSAPFPSQNDIQRQAWDHSYLVAYTNICRRTSSDTRRNPKFVWASQYLSNHCIHIPLNNKYVCVLMMEPSLWQITLGTSWLTMPLRTVIVADRADRENIWVIQDPRWCALASPLRLMQEAAANSPRTVGTVWDLCIFEHTEGCSPQGIIVRSTLTFPGLVDPERHIFWICSFSSA